MDQDMRRSAEDLEENHQEKKRLNRTVLTVFLVVSGVAFCYIIRSFVVPVVLAITFTTLFYPFYMWLVRHMKGSRGWASLVCCLLLMFGLVPPLYSVGHIVAKEAVDLYNTAEPLIQEVMERGDEAILSRLPDIPLFDRLNVLDTDEIDWEQLVGEVTRNGAKHISAVLNRTSRGVLGAVTTFFMVIFAMFYFFRDGDEILERIKQLSPLKDAYHDEIHQRFVLIARATVKGTLLVGLIQGSLGALTLFIFGVQTWIVWGAVMVVLAVIPMVGPWLVLVPAGMVQLVLGNVWQGVGIMLVGTLIIGNIDNLIRPRLVGRDAKMHDLLIFFSTLGGIGVFGIMGFIVGPVIAALFTTVLDIYGMEYREALDDPGLPEPVQPPAEMTGN